MNFILLSQSYTAKTRSIAFVKELSDTQQVTSADQTTCALQYTIPCDVLSVLPLSQCSDHNFTSCQPSILFLGKYSTNPTPLRIVEHHMPQQYSGKLLKSVIKINPKHMTDKPRLCFTSQCYAVTGRSRVKTILSGNHYLHITDTIR